MLNRIIVHCICYAQHAMFSEVQHYYIRRHDNILNMNYARPYSREINILREFVFERCNLRIESAFIFVTMRPENLQFIYNRPVKKLYGA